MIVSVQSANSYLQKGFSSATGQIGQLRQHIVGFLSYSKDVLNRNPRLAEVAFVIANVLFVETVFRLIIFFGRVIENMTRETKQNWSDSKTVLLLSAGFLVSSIAIAGLNVAFYYALRSTLSPFIATAISISTCIGYIFIKALR